MVHDAAGVDDDDAIREVQSGATVSDQQRRAVVHDRTQCRVDGLLHRGVDRAGGVVEQEDLRIAQQCPGKGDPLALSA